MATLIGHREVVYDVTFSPDGQRLASASRDNTVRLWDAQTGKQLAVLEGHTDGREPHGVTGVEFSRDGKRLASASMDGTVRLWFSEDTPERSAYRWQFCREKQAEEAEAAGEWLAAAFHLGELLNQDPDNKSLQARWDKSIGELAKVNKELAERQAAKRKNRPKTSRQ
jgi:WD40 repeat protein